MAEYSLTTPTFVAVGSSIPYNTEIIKGCCNIHHRPNSSIISLKGKNCIPTKYKISFHASVLGVAGIIQLGLFQDGEMIPETLMAVVPATTLNVWTVSAETIVLVDCDCTDISARVIAGATTTIDRANIIIEKVA